MVMAYWKVVHLVDKVLYSALRFNYWYIYEVMLSLKVPYQSWNQNCRTVLWILFVLCWGNVICIIFTWYEYYCWSTTNLFNTLIHCLTYQIQKHADFWGYGFSWFLGTGPIGVLSILSCLLLYPRYNKCTMYTTNTYYVGQFSCFRAFVMTIYLNYLYTGITILD